MNATWRQVPPPRPRCFIGGPEQFQFPVLRIVVPFLASNFTGLAPDTDRSIGEEALPRMPGGHDVVGRFGQLAHLVLLRRPGAVDARPGPAGSVTGLGVTPARAWYSAIRARSRPARPAPRTMSHDATLDSWIWTLGSSVTPSRSLAASPETTASCRRPSGRAARSGGRYDRQRPGPDPFSDKHSRLDRGTGRDNGGPPVGLKSSFGCQFGDTSQNISGWSSDEVRQPPAHPAGRVVLGEPVRGEYVRVDL